LFKSDRNNDIGSSAANIFCQKSLLEGINAIPKFFPQKPNMITSFSDQAVHPGIVLFGKISHSVKSSVS
jgi:hypothetical protein